MKHKDLTPQQQLDKLRTVDELLSKRNPIVITVLGNKITLNYCPEEEDNEHYINVRRALRAAIHADIGMIEGEERENRAPSKHTETTESNDLSKEDLETYSSIRAKRPNRFKK